MKQVALLLCDVLADAGPGGELSTEALRDSVRRLVAEHGHHWGRDAGDPVQVTALTERRPRSARLRPRPTRPGLGAWQPTPLAARFRVADPDTRARRRQR